MTEKPTKLSTISLYSKGMTEPNKVQYFSKVSEKLNETITAVNLLLQSNQNIKSDIQKILQNQEEILKSLKTKEKI